MYIILSSNLFDAVISIGVIHHFSTKSRRSIAIKELCRILRPGGKLMIYVWAYEQITRKFESQDVLVPSIESHSNKHKQFIKNNQRRNRRKLNVFLVKKGSKMLFSYLKDLSEHRSNIKERHLTQSLSIDYDIETSKTKPNGIKTTTTTLRKTQQSGIMSTITKFFSEKLVVSNMSIENIHETPIEYYNRLIKDNKEILPNEFQIRQFPMSSCENTFKEENDNELSENKKLLNDKLKRFYHVFKATELDSLISESCDELIIYKSYYDHGNWCVCAQKKSY